MEGTPGKIWIKTFAKTGQRRQNVKKLVNKKVTEIKSGKEAVQKDKETTRRGPGALYFDCTILITLTPAPLTPNPYPPLWLLIPYFDYTTLHLHHATLHYTTPPTYTHPQTLFVYVHVCVRLCVCVCVCVCVCACVCVCVCGWKTQEALQKRGGGGGSRLEEGGCLRGWSSAYVRWC